MPPLRRSSLGTGSPLGGKIDWIKIPEYGWIYRYRAGKHLMRTQNEAVLDQLTKLPHSRSRAIR